jgi:hypothetical protein
MSVSATPALAPASLTVTDPATSQPQSDDGNLKAGLNSIGEWRDTLLVLCSALYGLGYVVWGLNAWNENLGVLPAFEPQYVVAGIVPALVLWLAWRGCRSLNRFMNTASGRIAKWKDGDAENKEKKETKGWRATLLGCIAFVSFCGFLFLLSISTKYDFHPGMSAEAARWALAKASGVELGAYVLLFLSILTAGFTKFAKGWAYFVAVLYVFLILLFYLSFIYPHLPQELGGVSPRCAYLDLSKAHLSEPYQRELFATDAIMSNNPVERSRKLRSYFYNKDFMLVKPSDAEKTSTLEIRSAAIEGVTWCDSQ